MSSHLLIHRCDKVKVTTPRLQYIHVSSSNLGMALTNEERGNFICVMKDKTIPPGDDCARKRTMSKAVRRQQEYWAPRHDPQKDQEKNLAVIAKLDESQLTAGATVSRTSNKK